MSNFFIFFFLSSKKAGVILIILVTELGSDCLSTQIAKSILFKKARFLYIRVPDGLHKGDRATQMLLSILLTSLPLCLPSLFS